LLGRAGYRADLQNAIVNSLRFSSGRSEDPSDSAGATVRAASNYSSKSPPPGNCRIVRSIAIATATEY
jgi:hypothetical protein